MQNKRYNDIITAYELEKMAKSYVSPRRWLGERMFSGFAEKMKRLKATNKIISNWTKEIKPSLKRAKSANSQGRMLDMLAELSNLEKAIRSIAGAKAIVDGHVSVSAPDFDRPDYDQLSKMDIPENYFSSPANEIKREDIGAANDGLISTAGLFDSAGEYIQSLFDKQLRNRRLAAKELLGKSEILVKQIMPILDKMDDHVVDGDINGYQDQLNLIDEKAKEYTKTCNAIYNRNFKSEVERLKAKLKPKTTTTDTTSGTTTNFEQDFSNMPETGFDVEKGIRLEDIPNLISTINPNPSPKPETLAPTAAKPEDSDVDVEFEDEPEVQSREGEGATTTTTITDGPKADLYNTDPSKVVSKPKINPIQEKVLADAKAAREAKEVEDARRKEAIDAIKDKLLDARIAKAEAEENGDAKGVAQAGQQIAEAKNDFVAAKTAVPAPANTAPTDDVLKTQKEIYSKIYKKIQENSVPLKSSAIKDFDTKREFYAKNNINIPDKMLIEFGNKKLYQVDIALYEKEIQLLKNNSNFTDIVKDGIIELLEKNKLEKQNKIKISNDNIRRVPGSEAILKKIEELNNKGIKPDAPSAKFIQPVNDACPKCGNKLKVHYGRDYFISCTSYKSKSEPGCGFTLNPEKGKNPGKNFTTLKNNINPPIQTNLPCQQCGTDLKLIFGKLSGYFFVCPKSDEHKQKFEKNNNPLITYLNLAKNSTNDSSIKSEDVSVSTENKPESSSEVKLNTEPGKPVAEGEVIPFKTCDTCNGPLVKTRTLKRVKNEDGSSKIVTTDEFGGKCEKCNKFVLPAKDLKTLEELEAKKHDVKQEPVLPLVTGSPEEQEFDAEALTHISFIEEFYKYLLNNNPDNGDKNGWLKLVNNDIIKAGNKNNFEKSINLLNIIWYIEKKLGVNSGFKYHRGKKSNPAFRDAQGLGLHDVDTSIDPRVDEMLDEELGHEMADKEEEAPFVPDLKPGPEPLTVEPEVIGRRPLREPTQVSTPVNPGEKATLTSKSLIPLQAIVDNKPSAAKKPAAAKPVAQEATTEKKPGEPPTLTGKPFQGFVDLVNNTVAKPKETTTTPNKEPAKPVAKDKKGRKGVKANEAFYNELVKTASATNDPYLMATMLVRYSAQIEEDDFDTSMKLLAIAEGILDE